MKTGFLLISWLLRRNRFEAETDASRSPPDSLALATEPYLQGAIADEPGESEIPYPIKRVNNKRVLMLAGVLAVLGIAIHVAHGFQVDRNVEQLWEQALVVEREGKLKLAAECFDLYVRLVPEDTEGLLRLGLVLEKLADTTRERWRPFYLLDQVLRRDDDRLDDVQRLDLRRRVARLATEVYRFSDARDHLKILLQALPEDAELLQLKGRCLAADRRFKEAEPCYEQAVKLDPKRVDLSVEFAELLRDYLDQPRRADQCIAAMAHANKNSSEARVEAARYFRRVGLWDQAEPHIRTALEELGVQDAAALLLAGDVATLQGKQDLARTYLERGLKQYPHDGRLRRSLARLELLDGKRERARELLADLEKLPDEPLELWDLGNVLVDLGEIGPRLTEIIDRLPAVGWAWAGDYFQGRQAMRQNEWGRARVALEGVQKLDPTVPEVRLLVNVLLAECYGWLGNPDQQLIASTRALDVAPSSIAARQLLGAALVALGKPDQALAEYRQAAQRSPGARLEMARLERALALRRLREEGNWKPLEQILKAIPAPRQQLAEVQLLWAEIQTAQGKPEEARKLAEGVRDHDPKQVGPWLFLAELARQQGRVDEVLPLLEAAERRIGPRVEWQVVRADHWSRVGGAEGKQQLHRLAQTLPRLPEAHQDRLRLALAEALAAVDDLPAAERLWRQIAEHWPADVGVRMLLAELAAQAAQEAQVQRLRAEIERAEGKGGPVTLYTEALLALVRVRRGDQSALPEAQQRLARVAELRPLWARVPALEGELEELDGHPEAALEKYLAALKAGEGRLAVISRAVRLLCGQRRYAEADALLHKVSPQAMALGDMERLAAQVAALRPGDPDAWTTVASRYRALELARKVAPADSRDFRDHLWRAHVQAAAGRPDEAEQSLRRARDLAGADPGPWVALVLLLAQTDPPKAQAEMEAAQAKLDKNALALVRAAGYEAMGRTAEAEAQHLALVEARPNDPATLCDVASFYTRQRQSAKAEPRLRKLLHPALKAPEATVAWARRALVRLLGATGSFARFREALKLLDENDKGGATLEDRQTRAWLLATQPMHRAKAIGLLEELASSGSPSPEVHFLLAQLYEADGKWPRARMQLQSVLREPVPNLFYIEYYCRALLRQAQMVEAADWINRLEKLTGPTFTTVELRARLLHARGQATAGKIIESYAAQKDARLDLAAGLCDELGLTAKAEKLYKDHIAAAKDPERVLPLAEHLARHGRVAEALALCAKAWETCPLPPIVPAFTAAIRSPKATEADLQEAEQQLTRALQKDPNGIVLLMLRAELQHKRGGYAEAIQLYRTVVQLAPRHALALNNLAFLLALKEGKGEEALRLIDRAIDEVGPDAEYLDTRALVYLASNKPDLAAEDLRQAIAEGKALPRFLFHLARAQKLAKDEPGARETFDRAVALGLGEPALHPLERPEWQRLTQAFKKK
jgi:tetratricopeptide (TPR) repeat protein